MTSLFTPDEMPRVAKTLKTLETTIDTVVCADESQHVRNPHGIAWTTASASSRLFAPQSIRPTPCCD